MSTNAAATTAKRPAHQTCSGGRAKNGSKTVNTSAVNKTKIQAKETAMIHCAVKLLVSQTESSGHGRRTTIKESRGCKILLHRADSKSLRKFALYTCRVHAFQMSTCFLEASNTAANQEKDYHNDQRGEEQTRELESGTISGRGAFI